MSPPTLSGPSDYSVVQLGALLGVTTAAGSPPGGLLMVGGLHLVALDEGAPAPGVRSWIVTLQAGFVPVPHFAFTSFISNVSKNLLPSCGIRFRALLPASPSDPFQAEIYLVDKDENYVDPANVLGTTAGPLGLNFVSLGVAIGGPTQIPN